MFELVAESTRPVLAGPPSTVSGTLAIPRRSSCALPAGLCTLSVAWLALATTSCDDDRPTGPTATGSSPILFTSERDGNFGIFLMQPDVSGPRYLTRDLAAAHSADWLPNGYGVKIGTG